MYFLFVWLGKAQEQPTTTTISNAILGLTAKKFEFPSGNLCSCDRTSFIARSLLLK